MKRFNTHQSLDKGKIKKCFELRIDKDFEKHNTLEENKNLFATPQKGKLGRANNYHNKIKNPHELASVGSNLSYASLGRNSSANKFNVSPCNFRVETKGKFEDQFDIVENIGEGGFGVVKLIKNKLTKEMRAVKIITKSKCQTTKDFSDEITILQTSK